VRRFKEWGEYYITQWKVNLIFAYPSAVPVHSSISWADTETPSLERFYQLYKEASEKVRDWRRRGLRLAMVTGAYQAGRDDGYVHVVIDVDSPGVSGEDLELLKRTLARYLTVVETSRGFHVHAEVPASEAPYRLVLTREVPGIGIEQAGEGAGTMFHGWTLPPSVRGRVTYRFVLPDGTRVAKYSEEVGERLLPPRLRKQELFDLIEEYVGVKITEFSGAESATGAGTKVAELAVDRHRPAIFTTIEDFTARAWNFPQPVPVYQVYYNYFASIGAETMMAMIVARAGKARYYIQRKIPQGLRFLSSAEFVLHLGHMIVMPEWEPVLELLSYAVEGWPEDKGGRLDKKLRYLVVFDETGKYYLPRYSGLGPFRPLAACTLCAWKPSCDRKIYAWNRIAYLYWRTMPKSGLVEDWGAEEVEEADE